MKKILLSIGTLIITSIAISQTTQICPSSFKRSNGAGGGCPIAKLTLVYATCPTTALPIDSVYQSGVKINATFDAGIITCTNNSYEITYCITSSNIAPTGFLTIYFHAAGAFNGNTCTVPTTGGPLPVKLTDFSEGARDKQDERGALRRLTERALNERLTSMPRVQPAEDDIEPRRHD